MRAESRDWCVVETLGGVYHAMQEPDVPPEWHVLAGGLTQHAAEMEVVMRTEEDEILTVDVPEDLQAVVA